MYNGRPTVKWIGLCILLGFGFSVDVFQDSIHARRVAQKRDKVSIDLRERARHASVSEHIPIIIQFDDVPNSNFDSEIIRRSGRAGASFRQLHARAVEVQPGVIEGLASRFDAGAISRDRQNIRFPLSTNGVLVSDSAALCGGVLVSDGAMISESKGLGRSTGLLSSGVLVSDVALVTGAALVSDGVLVSDKALNDESADTGVDYRDY